MSDAKKKKKIENAEYRIKKKKRDADQRRIDAEIAKERAIDFAGILKEKSGAIDVYDDFAYVQNTSKPRSCLRCGVNMGIVLKSQGFCKKCNESKVKE